MRLAVRVIPNARRTEFSGERNGEALLRLNAPAVDGKANRAAVEFLSDYFDIARSRVVLVSGEKSRHKIFELIDLDAGIVEDLLRKPGQQKT